MDKKGKEQSAATAPDPARSVGRLVGLGVGVTVGLAAATTGLVAGVPAPDLVLRAVCAGVAFKIVAGWGGSTLARSLMLKPEAPPDSRPEGDR
jgi:hypothetical protein